MGYPITQHRTISFEVDFDGKKAAVTHKLKMPTAEHKREYWQSSSEAELENSKGEYRIPVVDFLRIHAELYDALIVEVTGYDWSPKPDDWKVVIPDQHKRAAVVSLLDTGRIGEATAKNS